jgi:tripartite ATP-independent transporter DctM subunit
MADILDLLMFVVAFGLLMAGYHVAFTLAGTAIAFAALGHVLGDFPIGQLAFMAQRMYGIMSNEVLVAVPLFVFMGLMLERSKVAEDLLVGMASQFRRAPGGLAISVTIVGALLAASTGIVGATVVTMGLLSLPVMLKSRYDPKLAAGTICAAGTLGQIIPPSIVLVFLGDFLSYANQRANLQTGNLTGRSVSVGDLFAGCLIPGLALVLLYLAYQVWVAWRDGERCPPVLDTLATDPGSEQGRGTLLNTLAAPLALIIAVLGSILLGIATPTEAAGVGAVGATVLGARRKAPHLSRIFLAGVLAVVVLVMLKANFDLRFQRSVVPTGDLVAIIIAFVATLVIAAALVCALWVCVRDRIMDDVVRHTARITAMVFAILIGASLFTLVFRGFGGEETVQNFLNLIPGGLFGAMLVVMLVVFLLGFFLDFLEIIFIVVPIVAPALIIMGADPIWLGVMIAINLQTSFLTPPFGFALFYLRAVAPDGLKTSHIYRGVVPFIGIQLFALALVAMFPQLATWLPRALF